MYQQPKVDFSNSRLQSGALNDTEYTQSLDMLKREMSKNPHLNNTENQTLNDMIKSKTGGENLHLLFLLRSA